MDIHYSGGVITKWGQLFDPAARPEPSLQGGLIDTKLMNVGPLHKVTLTQSGWW